VRVNGGLPVLQMEALVNVIEVLSNCVNICRHIMTGDMSNHHPFQMREYAQDRLGIKSLTQHFPRSNATVMSSGRHTRDRMGGRFVVTTSLHEHNVGVALSDGVNRDA
jgi:hypothetical protein